MMSEDWCLIPCFFCSGGLRNCGCDDGNQPLGGTEFIGGGCYGSVVTDVQQYRFAINLCDECLKDAIESKHVLKVIPATRIRQPQDSYEILSNENQKDTPGVTEEELLNELRKARMGEACLKLEFVLFGGTKFKGVLCMGTDKIIIYTQNSEREWFGHHHSEWEGFPLEWHYDCGEAKADSQSF